MDSFNDKVILITGGGKGIGKGIALEFARRGAKVAFGCNSNAEMAKETLTELEKYTEALMIQSDIENIEGCKYLVDKTIEKFGKIDIFVNNAALQTQFSLLESSPEILKKEININLRAAVFMIQYVYPYLKKSPSGRIIIISSVHGKRPTDFDAAYSISKGGLEMLCREAAIEFGADKITVNIIAPAAVRIEGKTGNPKQFTLKNVDRKRHFRIYPFGRVGLPSDVASIACFLASGEASQISGTTIRIDGCSMLL